VRFLSGKVPIFKIVRIRGLSVFIRKNSKSLKRRRYKGFCVFLLYGIVLIVQKYKEKKAKKAKNPILGA